MLLGAVGDDDDRLVAVEEKVPINRLLLLSHVWRAGSAERISNQEVLLCFKRMKR